jgi:hypothetical protein
MSESPGDRLKAARERAGFNKAVDACRAFGWPYAAYIHHENGTRTISIRAASRYAAAYGPKTGLKVADLINVDATIETTSGVQVIGGAAMGVWLDSTLEPVTHARTERLKLPASPGHALRLAVKVLDTSVNKAIPPNTFAIFEPLGPEISDPEQFVGCLLYIEIERNGLIERSIRMATLGDDGRLALTAYSTDPRFSQVAHYPCTEHAVTLIGRVVGKWEEFPGKLPT